jgi:hypothetical protein
MTNRISAEPTALPGQIIQNWLLMVRPPSGQHAGCQDNGIR